jgi:putative Holliday junction resolvase
LARILCLDYGGKRTGIAVTDPMQIIATPLDNVETSKLMDFLKKYISSEEVETLVVGQPTRHDGSFSPIEEEILKFITQFQSAFPQIQTDRINEMFSSKDAMQALIASGVPMMKRRDKKLLDKTAAALILQEYLNLK